MLDLGETPPKIALFLGIDDGTVYRRLENYQRRGLDGYLENRYFGYWGKPLVISISRIARGVKLAAA